jgi:serine/threonine protein kinase
VLEYAGSSAKHVFSEGLLASMTKGEKRALADKLCRAVASLHAGGFCHLDLKPQNIVFQKGFSVKVKLVDFETAQRIGKRGVAGCTPAYGSPEIRRAQRSGAMNGLRAAPAMDVFSLGLILAELFAPGHQAVFNLEDQFTQNNGNDTKDGTGQQEITALDKMTG